MLLEAQDSDNSLIVFVSYSRQDSVAADSLVLALENKGFTVTIDRRDLPFGEEWQAELQDFIVNSDAVVWMVSPASIASRWVNWELGEVQRAGKRLVPIVVKDIDRANLPETLGKIHLMPVAGTFDEAAHLSILAETLETDWTWLKESTRLGIAARAWANSGNGKDRLLRGKALRAAEDWAALRPNSAPVPGPGILDFITASQVQAKRRQRNWIGGLSITAAALLALSVFAFIQRDVAIQNELLAEKNERTATERAARLSVPVARSLREEGFVPQSLLVLLEASRQFDDSTAPANLKIEMEQSLTRANMERGRELLPPETRIATVSDKLVGRDAEGNSVDVALLESTQYRGLPATEFDCARIYEDLSFGFPWPDKDMVNREVDPEFGYDQFGYKLNCKQKGGFVLLVQTLLGASGGTDTFAIFSLGLEERVFSMDKRIGEVFFDWVVDGPDADQMAFAFVDLRTITIQPFTYGFPGDPQTITVDRELTTLKFASLNRMLAVTGIDYEDGSVSPGDRWVYDFDLKPQKPFLELLEVTEDSDLINITNYELNSLSLLHPMTCINHEVGVDNTDNVRCETVSPDGQWSMVRTANTITLFKAGQETAVGTIEREWNQFDFVTFYKGGPDLLMVDKQDGQAVFVWTPPAMPGADWTRELVYRSPDYVEMVEADASGDRLSIGASGEARTISGLVYSISAREIWRDLGSTSPWGVVRELKDGSVVASFHEEDDWDKVAVQRFPEVSELSRFLQNALPQNCRAENPESWRSTPCWPLWID